MTQDISVVADIGGTNTRVALCQNGTVLAQTIRRYRNSENTGIGPILDNFLSAAQATPVAVCIDMAGPVSNGVGTLTNLDWRVDADILKSETGAVRVAVLNDLQAQGFAVSHLGPESLLPLLSGRSAYSMGGQTIVPPAEAGHVSLQARTPEELDLIDWISERYGTPGLEEVLSGRGLEHLYAWVCHDIGDGLPLPAAEIMEAFTAGEARAERAARMFVRYLGRYAGDLALLNLPFGGIYLVGGVTRHLGPHMLRLGFAEAFADKGRFNAYMTQFPVALVTDDYAALRGCAAHLSELQEA
jgi:glucokinase